MRFLFPSLALLLAALAIGPAARAAADPVAVGTTKLTLSGGLFAGLKRDGVRLAPRRPGGVRGPVVTLPVLDGDFDFSGSGRLLHEGGVKLVAGRRAASLADFELNTEKGFLVAAVGGRRMRFATIRGRSAKRHGFAANVALRELRLTSAAARALGAKLGLHGVFRAGRSFASAAIHVRFEEVTVTYGTAYLTLGEAFMAKLRSLEVGAEPLGAGWYFSRSPLAVALTGLHGTAALDLSSGAVASEDGLRLFQGEVKGGEVRPLAGAPEIALGGISLDFAARSAAAEIKAQPSGAGETTSFADVAFSTVHDSPVTGVISIPDTSATLTPYLAGLLNQAFAEPKGRAGLFAAGEPLGAVAFMAGTRGPRH